MRQNFLFRNTNLRRRGMTLSEMVVGMGVVSVTFFGALTLTTSVLHSSEKLRTESGLTNDARLSTDEMLYGLRSAERILVSATVGGRTYTTGATEVVFQAPGYQVNGGGDGGEILSGVTDLIAYRYDPDTQKITESIEPGTGSARPARSEKVIATNVESMVFTFKQRDASDVVQTLEGAGVTGDQDILDDIFGVDVDVAFTPSANDRSQSKKKYMQGGALLRNKDRS